MGASTGGMQERGIHGDIERLARDLHGAPGQMWTTPDTLLADVTQAAVDILPGVDHSAVTLVVKSTHKSHRPSLESTAATSAVAVAVDQIQHTLGEGPCVAAAWRQRSVRIDDLADESRWPRFALAIIEQTPVRAAMAIQLFTNGEELGALNLYSETPNSFSDDLEDLAHQLSTHAAIALSGSRRGQQFRSALASRDTIGQAKGIIMERFGIDAVAAFQLLRRLSQESNTALAVIAEQLVSGVHNP
ncbi:GAF and ANTAR domain-containing protein [Gordonia soli]|uniref:ANTAR domain-containing protein n=1 Tax=Gordonia soli NBRC 108243 TaxID=1223545 RepID=M0QES6_9ACTN|nr:GAF and ANTAR domain-containing protein [Gordonia soli]GAC67110.1 hypothetical protein GS4_05_03230 [Gordonia soli NBRC 108243]